MGGLRTGIRPVHIVATSKMVCDYSGMMVQPHKVGFPLETWRTVEWKPGMHGSISFCAESGIAVCDQRSVMQRLHRNRIVFL